MKIAEVRRFALSLPEVTEAPHFDKPSFRVRGRIFATVPPGGSHLHVFVDEAQRERMTAIAPQTYETLRWGKKVVGLRVTLLLQAAWQLRAPKSVIRPR
ncbi:MAG TPA: MmcQ/YjbR family DNA-binding protein [bacterium]|nr:MmcQ/YjbR family DNA-binding protein [bacterium]